MKYLGIDYGTKRVGLALSDETGEMAFPKEVVLRDYNFFSYLLNFIHTQKVEAVVIGSSYRQDGVAKARRRSGGLEHLPGLLPDCTAPRLRLRARRTQRAVPDLRIAVAQRPLNPGRDMAGS